MAKLITFVAFILLHSFCAIAQCDSSSVESISEGKKNPLCVKELYLFDTNLSREEIREIKYFINLEKLVVSKCDFFEINEFIYDLHNLQYISISETKLLYITPMIIHARALKILGLSENDYQVQAHIFQIPNLEFLTIYKNKLREIPEKFSTNLKSISIVNCDLKTLHSSVFSHSIEKLVLIGNKIETLPDIQSDNYRLKNLHLTDNLIKKLPNSINKLKELERLRVGVNKLIFVPKSIFELKNLTYLEIGDTPLARNKKALLEIRNGFEPRISQKKLFISSESVLHFLYQK